MHRSARIRLLTASLLALSLFVPLVAGSVAAPPQSAAVERVIIVFNDSVTDAGAAADALSRRHNATVSLVYEHALKGVAAEIPAQAMAGIARDPRVAFVERDQIVQAFDVPTGVDRIEADKNGTAKINGVDERVDVDVAILDTGIDKDHPDLNVVGGVNCSGGSPFKSSCEDGNFADGNGHGTHVAGTVAALDNDFGVVGVAPGARLWAVKVLNDNGSGYMSWIVAGIDWVTSKAGSIEVANMSLGCECSSAAMDTALNKSTDAGVVYVVAAGNSKKDASSFSPANHDQVIAVSAMADFDGLAGGAAPPTCRDDVGDDDTFATFSNFGPVVDLAAPGVCIESTIPGGGYAMFSGTSMASPHVAGAAALYIVEKNIGHSSTDPRWETVRDGLQTDWAVPQSDPCGFSGGISNEPFLMLVATCDTASGDSTPSVSITNPADGATVSGSVTITAAASDDNGVTQVEFFVDGASIGIDSDFSDGWSVSWDTTTVIDGGHTLTATATDTAGQTASHSV
ncbi:MAG TPA: S8 family serine peptidase, partial [Thermomicrobiales bacterium]|nr:S8 family serine peptidase [Thermomicrobiales bacterium]